MNWSRPVLALSFVILGLFAFMPFVASANAQTIAGSNNNRAALRWSRTYGSGDVFGVEQTSDGGYIVAGVSVAAHGIFVARLLKLDRLGGVIWQKQYTTVTQPGFLFGNSVQQTIDGGYVIGGQLVLPDGGGGGWVLKTDPMGNVIWSKTYISLFITSVQPTSDGGYFAVGNGWAAKLDSYGNVTWQRIFRGGNDFFSGQQTSDGGYVMSGGLFNDYCCKAWVLKLDQYGNVTWQNAYGEPGGIETASSIQQTPDGGYAVAGQSPGGALWVFKLEASGDLVWQKDYPGTSGLGGNALDLTGDGGYIVGGYDGAGLALRLNSTGDIVWSSSLGGTVADIFYSAQSTTDGGYVLAGHDFSFGDLNGDLWVVKLNSRGQCCRAVAENGFTVTEETTGASAITTTITPIPTAIPATTRSVIAQNTTYAVLTQCAPRPA